MPQPDRILRFAAGALTALRVANLAAGALFVALLAFSWIWAAPLAAQLQSKYGAGVVMALRVAVLLAPAVVAAAHALLTLLARMVASVRQGDSFVAENADRLVRIGWALLAIQLVDLCMGALIGWLDRLQVERMDWTPGIGGWIALLMVFVLARVFRVGARMRDELAMTV